MISLQLCFLSGALSQVHEWGQGSVARTLPIVLSFAYSSYVFEWMEPCDARLILFQIHTSLHYIDTAADLRSRSKIEFLQL